MRQIQLKYIKSIPNFSVKRNEDGNLTHVCLYGKNTILMSKMINIKFFSEEAKEYIFSKYAKQLSSLEKELL